MSLMIDIIAIILFIIVGVAWIFLLLYGLVFIWNWIRFLRWWKIFRRLMEVEFGKLGEDVMKEVEE